MPEISLADWRAFLNEHPGAHLLQSAEWGELKTSFGWEAVRLACGDTGAQILFRHGPLGLTFAYIPKGPVNSASSALFNTSFWKEVDDLCRSRKAIFTKVEPNGWLGATSAEFSPPPPGFVFSPQHVQPASTLRISLAGSEEEIFERMKPKTRYNIRLAGRKEVVVNPSTDLENFHRVMQITGQREAFHVHSYEYYRRAYDLFNPGGGCELFTAVFQGSTLAALMVFAYGREAYYFYGASTNEERNRKATYPLQWEAIRWARRHDCDEYDMWGIPEEAAEAPEEDAETREDGLWGVYRFKRGFGGQISRAFPSMDRVYNPLLYRLYLWRFGSSSSD